MKIAVLSGVGVIVAVVIRRAERYENQTDGVRSRTLIPLTTPSHDPVKTRLSESEPEAKNKPITRPRIEHCDWFVLLLLLSTLTM